MTRTLGIVRGESGALAVADTCHVPSLSPERVNEAHDDIPAPTEIGTKCSPRIT